MPHHPTGGLPLPERVLTAQIVRSVLFEKIREYVVVFLTYFSNSSGLKKISLGHDKIHKVGRRLVYN
jgi:hypothetical protein